MEIKGFTLAEPPYQGGMALVYHGKKGYFDRAFKMVRPDKAANNPKLSERFLSEIKVQVKLDHPNIIKMLDAFPYTNPDNGMTMTVIEMEWLSGMDLQRYVEKVKPKGIDAATTKKIALRVAEGMAYAHSKNVLHLDIKPSNIFYTKEGVIKIIDFGIARVMGENSNIVNGAERITLMTETGESTFKGTAAFAAPEQQVGGKLGFYSDVYAFGKTLRFLLTGTNDPSVNIADRQLADIIAKCTADNPNHRYQNFNEVAEAIKGQSAQKRKCPKCGAEIMEGAKFCPFCGHKIEAAKPKQEKCPNCGRPRQEGSKFCYGCGHQFDGGPKIKKVLTGYRCTACGKVTKAYSDGKVNFCNFCGSPKTKLAPLYEAKQPTK